MPKRRLSFLGLGGFFILAYGISWTAWILEANGVPGMAFPGYFGPAIASLILIFWMGGKNRLQTFTKRWLHWRLPIRWYLLTIMIPVGSLLPVIMIRLLNGQADFLPAQLITGIPQLGTVFIVGSLYGILVTAGEELGWRGYALPVLLKRHSPLIASLMIGFFWSFWHAPLSWLYPGDISALDFWLYGLGIQAAFSQFPVFGKQCGSGRAIVAFAATGTVFGLFR